MLLFLGLKTGIYLFVNMQDSGKFDTLNSLLCWEEI